MSFKNICSIASIVLLSIVSQPAISNNVLADATTDKKPAKVENTKNIPLMRRLEDIKAADKSVMTSMEKKALRKEVKQIKKEMVVNNGGIYLSVGAIIIVILLLILLL